MGEVLDLPQVTIKNQKLLGNLFWQSFGGMMTLKEISVKDKLALARLKDTLVTEIDALATVLKDATEEDKSAVLANEFKFNFKPVNVPLELLTAEEIYQLDGFIKE